MFKNYLRIAIRNLLKHKTYSLINIAGLSTGIVCCIFIFLWIQNELSFDNHHEKGNQIFRVCIDAKFSGTEINQAVTSVPLASALRQEYPEVKETTRLCNNGLQSVQYQNNSFIENRFFYADQSFFNVFTIPFIRGNPEKAFVEPFSVVLTKSTAEKYFGNNDPIGKMIKLNNDRVFKIVGVVKDLPDNSHFHFDFLASFNSLPESNSNNWYNNFIYTYIVLQKNYPVNELETKLPDLLEKYIGTEIKKVYGMTISEYFKKTGDSFRYYLQPLKDIHLYSHLKSEIEANSDIKYVYIFSIIALFILIIACVNYMNLATARSVNRSKEIGVRKVVGSNKFQLIGQFIGESILFCIISICISGVLLEILLPIFNQFTNRTIDVHYFQDASLIAFLLGIVIVVSILSGTYPALFLSSLHPTMIFKQKLNQDSKNNWLRNGLIVFQFVISIILIVGTMTVYNQLMFIQEKKLGFDKENVMMLNRVQIMKDRVQAFKQELLKNPNIISCSASSVVPGIEFISHTIGHDHAPFESRFEVNYVNVDSDFFQTFDVQLKQGQLFSKKQSTDVGACLLNEAAVSVLGLTNPIGVKVGGGDRFHHPILGVVKNFHFASLHKKIGPLAIYQSDDEIKYLSVRLSSKNISQTIQFIKKTWERFIHQEPFVFFFLDDKLYNQYSAEQKTSVLMVISTLLAILIACLGLIGLTAFMLQKRTKEIGIRKVLGASISGIVLLLTKEFTKWVLIANIIAWPVAWYAMNKWLQNFAYRIELTFWPFVLAGIIALVIALFTVSFQTIRTATANPVEALRYE